MGNNRFPKLPSPFLTLVHWQLLLEPGNNVLTLLALPLPGWL